MRDPTTIKAYFLVKGYWSLWVCRSGLGFGGGSWDSEFRGWGLGFRG